MISAEAVTNSRKMLSRRLRSPAAFVQATARDDMRMSFCCCIWRLAQRRSSAWLTFNLRCADLMTAKNQRRVDPRIPTAINRVGCWV
jgi:hypothetical protein